MTGISEEYITEAALVPAVGVESTKRSRFASLALALNNGWGVACICLLLAIAAVVGILHWGLPGASVNPFPPAVDPNAPRYIFTMDSLHSFSYGESVDRPAEQGEQIFLSLSILNNGSAFQIRDSEWTELSAVCVLQSDDSVTLEWRYSPRDGGNQPYWVQTGATETLGFVLTIPENATPGVYDLVLSYKGVEQVFSGALTVGDPDTNSSFSVGYENLSGNVAVLGGSVRMDTWIVNNGAPFTFTGSSMGFVPYANLIHRHSGYSIQGMFDATTDYVEVTVNTGDKGSRTQEFFIPADAPTGDYDLILTYDTATKTFEKVLTVAIPIQEEDHLFSFGYELAGDALTGVPYLMDTWVINEGEPFTYEGSSMGFAPTASLIHMETQYRIDGSFGMDDDQGIFTVNTGDVGRVTQEFFIPAGAPTGAYALELSYGGMSKTFPGVVIVAEPTVADLDYPLLEDGHPFSFGYEPFGGFAIPGDMLTVKVWVINEGEPFSFIGDPYSFQPVATLYHMESGYVIQGHSAPTGVPPRPCNVLTGQKGSISYSFPIPADAPTGEYELMLSYHGQEQSFEGFLTVATP